MRVRLQKDLLVVSPEETELETLGDWLRTHGGQVFRLENAGDAAIFHALGPEDEACRKPINISSRSPMPLQLASNFAHTPFVLDDRRYASVEGFWQGLKFPQAADRLRLASLYGDEARDSGLLAPAGDAFDYAGRLIRIGTFEHWRLMERACLAKFEQNPAAREALLSTGHRPITHRVEPDSRNIPGVIMAEIWMRIRDHFHNRVSPSTGRRD
jgi:predicted NAD-dependent protein-ADP-ribosyltransferase YbiA (DUF1768 family)